MIELVGVSKRYGDVAAVTDLSMSIGDGELCVLIGPSGCGKTTTLRMINRLIEPTAGRILLDGRDTEQLKPEELRRGIGYAIQSVGLFPHMTVGENIAVVPRLLRWDDARVHARVDELLDLVGLAPDEYRPKYPRELSGGQGQRIGVARALAADPPVLLMDEPFGAVDPFTRERLQTEFARIHKTLKKTVVFVTHDLDEAIRLADRLAIMREGRLVQYDTPEEILASPADIFVRDFVGADRALKRLARVCVADVMSADPTQVKLSDMVEDARRLSRSSQSLWVTDDEGVLLGWARRSQLKTAVSIDEALFRCSWQEIAVSTDATLREGLSRMLAEGFRTLPVVDSAGHLRGEVSLATFAKLSGSAQDGDESLGAGRGSVGADVDAGSTEAAKEEREGS